MDGLLSPGGKGGFTLIEVMIAMFILTVGLLALAGVQVSGMKGTTDGYMRTQAAIAAMDMADRMRANIAGVNANAYAAVGTAVPAAPTSNCLGTGSTCTSADIANHDIYEWKTSIGGDLLLPGAVGTVTCNDSPCVVGSAHTIKVMWDGRRNGATGTGCVASTLTDLLCYQVTFRP